MPKKYAISDIHGCAKTFEALLDKIAFSKADELYLLGDYMDRGPDTKGVFDQIFKLKDDGYFLKCLMGNHEEMYLSAYHDFSEFELWHNNGGSESLKSFGTRGIRGIPEVYRDFVVMLENHVETEGCVLVHAGLNFKNNDPLADAAAMRWIRKWYADINYDWLGDRIIVHGHTPIFPEEIASQFSNLNKNRYLDIDAGCVFAHRGFAKQGLGRLAAFDLTNRDLFFQAEVE